VNIPMVSFRANERGGIDYKTVGRGGVVMMNFTQFIMALIISTTITSALTPMARRFALRMGLVDVPNPRRINKVPMPTGGGMAIFVGFFAASLVGEIPHVSVTLLAAF